MQAVLDYFQIISNSTSSIYNKSEYEVLSNEIMQEIINLVDIVEPYNGFKGLFVVEILSSKTLIFRCKDNVSNILNKNEEKIIHDWLQSTNKLIYLQGFYRLDFTNYIYLFKEYKTFSKKILVGHLLDNTIENKLQLTETKQNFLMNLVSK